MNDRIIGCVGPAGGPGVTTVAAQMASAFSRHGVDTVLVDFDMDGSPLTLAFGATDNSGMSNLYELGELAMPGDDALALALQPAGDHLRVVSGFSNLELGPEFRPAIGVRVITAIAANCDVCILDMGRPRLWNVLDVLKSLDIICWVVTPTPEGMWAWRRMWNTFDGKGVPKQKMVAVINQYNHPRALQNLPQDWAARYAIPVVARVPYSPKLSPDALFRPRFGRAASRNEKECAKAYDSFVNKVAGDLDTYQATFTTNGGKRRWRSR